MALLHMFSIRDRAANTFARPFCMPNQQMAVRIFSDEINRADEGNPLYKHPEDYDLWYVGRFDEDDANIDENQPKQIAVGKDLAKPQQ